jgi:Peptidase family M28
MLKRIALYLVAVVAISGASGQTEPPSGPETVLPLPLLRQIINEVSGDLAFQNEVLLGGAYRNRLPQEYGSRYFETDFVLRKLQEYGIEDAEVIDLPTRSEKTWDAESAELWVTKPAPYKLADLREVPACLSSGSATTDTTAGLVYVGPGDREEFYQGKEVKGKVALVNGAPEMARRLAVEKFGALGLIGYESSHPEYDPDQVGWSGIRVSEKELPTFAFMVSTRQGQELRDSLERGAQIEVRAVCKTQQVPYKEQMVSALLPGRDFPEEELVFTAHLFEGVTMRGANDNDSGVVAVLETARSLKKLASDGRIPPLRRSVRFLFVPEISGTAAYIEKYPDVAKRFFANINEDMVGEALARGRSFFNLERTPDSLPSTLNDVLESIFRWVDFTQNKNWEYEGENLDIVSPNGSGDPFYFSIKAFAGGSDHIVFNDGGVGVPAVTFNGWPDMWYHTNRDTPDKSDPTQLKRAVFIGVAAAAFLANAGPVEVQKMAAETSGRAVGRLGLEKLRAENMILNAEAKDLATAYKEALNIVQQGFGRENKALASIRFFIKNDAALEALLKGKIESVEEVRPLFVREIDDLYKRRCLMENRPTQKPALSDGEIRLSRLVPMRTEKMRGYFNGWEFYQKVREMKVPPSYRIGRADFEVRNFIDGRRSILDIRNAVSAESGPIGLEGVENYILLLEKTGYVKIEKK